MEQYTDSQYDDDLTIGSDEYDDSFLTTDVDLFEFGGDEDSAISRLKSLVLSIDWEITDEVLQQFNDEILDLKDIWANEKIRMVYLQALEKIGKYISREKADSHPNAIRLLLSMYYNLERIVLSDELSEAEKKKILLEDVRRFEKLKKLIGKGSRVMEPIAAPEPVVVKGAESDVGELFDLKAIVLGIDWEIAENDLLALREEAMRLEEIYADSKPKLVFLQGIGTLGAYIRKKKSNAHADAFKILHSFYEGLEKLVRAPYLTLEQEKEILRPEVNKFNALKSVISGTLGKKDRDEDESEDEEGIDLSGSTTIVPAFADLPEEGTFGFQEEIEAKALKLAVPINVDEHIDKFFGEEEKPAAALADTKMVSSGVESAEREAEEFSAAFFDGGEGQEAADFEIDRATALQGVDVETEADDESGEEALPVVKGEVAPALADSGDTSAFGVAEPRQEAPEEVLAEELTGRLDDFFNTAEAPEGPTAPVLTAFEVPAAVALQGVDVETEADEEEEPVAPVSLRDTEGPAGISAPAFAETEELPRGPEEESPAGMGWEDEPVAAFGDEDIPAALFSVDETLEEAEAGLEEEAVEQRFDELFASLPEEGTPTVEAAVEEEVEAFFSLEEPEEVAFMEPAFEEAEGPVFELAEEEPVEAPATEEVVEIEGAEIGIEEVVEELVPELQYRLDAEPELAAEGGLGEAFIEEPVIPAEPAVEEVVTEGEVLTGLRGCVQSIGIEVDDVIIRGLSSEIASLRQRWDDRPLAKTFLQLMSTVAHHIDQYRYGASDDSNTLLVSIMDDLERSTAEVDKAQELLLASTGKVLQWQQAMLERQAVRGEDGYLAFVDTARVAKVAPAEELFLEEEPEEAVAAEPPAEPFEEEVEEEAAVSLQEAVAEEPLPAAIFKTIDVSEGNVSEIIRQEIDALRDTLKKEIAELRKAMNMDDGNR